MNKKEDDEEEEEEEERERRVSCQITASPTPMCIRKEKIKFPLIRPSTRITAESSQGCRSCVQREHREVSAVDYTTPLPPCFGVSYKTRGTATSKSSVQLCISIQANFPRKIMSSYSFAVKNSNLIITKKISDSAD